MHHFIDFKSFKQASISLIRPLTILVGPNGSGKSNAIEGLEVLASVASGAPLHEITDLNRPGALNVRGGLQGCTRYGGPSFTLGFSASMMCLGQSQPVRYSVTVVPLPTPVIGPEYLMVGDTILFQTIAGRIKPTNGNRPVQYTTIGDNEEHHSATVPWRQSALSQCERFAARNQWPDETFGFIDNLRHHLRRSFVLDPRPETMRGYERIDNDSLLPNGSNLSSVLYALSKKDNDLLNHLFSHVQQAPDEPYDRLDFVTTPLDDVILGLHEQHSQNLSDARVLSDGTLRTLAVLAAVATAERHSSVVVEEFDNGLHPSRVASLVQKVARIGKSRQVNLLLSTHNPAVLNALTFEQQQNVVLAFRSNDDYCSRLLPLTKVTRFDELLERGRLGDLVTRRIVNQYLDPEFEKKRAEAMDRWLARLAK